MLALVIALAAGGGVATALFVVPRATGALRAVTAATVYADPDETVAAQPEDESAALREGDAALGGEPEVPVGEPEPETLDPDHALEQLPARMPEGVRKVPANRPIALDDVEIEVIEGSRPWVIHRFAPLETIDQVAARYEVTPAALRTWNGLAADAERLEPGARVKLEAGRVPPPRQQVDYVVQAGDTWWSIAVAHGIDSRALRAGNPQAALPPRVGETLALWIDPAVLHWVQTDPATTEDPRSAIRRGAVGVGPPDAGWLINGVQLPAGKGWRRQRPASSYGTTRAVTNLVVALQTFRETSGYERELLLGSMSLPHGGPLPEHRSHQTGREIDIRLPLTADNPAWFPIKPWRVDYEALWRLVEALADTGEIEVIFLDYGLQKGLHKAATALGSDEAARHRLIQWPRGRAEGAGLVQDAGGGHRAHIHVRFRCGRHETECVSSGDPL